MMRTLLLFVFLLLSVKLFGQKCPCSGIIIDSSVSQDDKTWVGYIICGKDTMPFTKISKATPILIPTLSKLREDTWNIEHYKLTHVKDSLISELDILNREIEEVDSIVNR